VQTWTREDVEEWARVNSAAAAKRSAAAMIHGTGLDIIGPDGTVVAKVHALPEHFGKTFVSGDMVAFVTERGEVWFGGNRDSNLQHAVLPAPDPSGATMIFPMDKKQFISHGALLKRNVRPYEDFKGTCCPIPLHAK